MEHETSIRDLQCAAFLMACGHTFLRAEGQPRQKSFVFMGVPAGETERFYRGEAQVNARRLLDCYRTLRGLGLQAG